MRLRLLLAFVAIFSLNTWTSAQTNSGWVPSSPGTTNQGPAPTPAPVAATTTNAGTDSGAMTSADFEIDGVPYAKVLYLEGNVWVRPPGDLIFHHLEEDEPIANGSVLYTGYNGTLDFATGPGMAVRMVPKTGLIVKVLPAPATSTAPVASQIDLRKGTIFSALGRENGGALDFSVQTPVGIAAARGTMFATSAVGGTTQVSMLHGTVNFETPDHQTSQITAGQSQQITGGWGAKYQMAKLKPMSPNDSEAFFNHASHLLEHASGYGVVRRGLGPDVAREMQRHGYKMPSSTMARMQTAGQMHYKSRPVFNRAKAPNARSTTYHNPASNTKNSGGTPERPSSGSYHPPLENERTVRRYPGPVEWPEKDKDRNW